MGRSALDTGGGGNCFFRAVSHQLYGTPNNHFYVCILGIRIQKKSKNTGG